MTALEILQAVESAGVAFRLRGGRLQASGPLPEDLAGLVRANRAEIMAALVEDMDLNTFEKAGLLVELATPTGPVYLASDTEASRRAPEGVACWTTAELRKTLDLSRADLARLSKVKRAFSGVVVSLDDDEAPTAAVGGRSEPETTFDTPEATNGPQNQTSPFSAPEGPKGGLSAETASRKDGAA